MVIYFTVVRNPNGSILITHRLGGSVTQVYYGETAVSESHASIIGNPKTSTVGSPVNHAVPHPYEVLFANRKGVVIENQCAYNPAHDDFLSSNF
jgi:hypothetical protein